MDAKVTIPALQAMKRDGKKSIGLVAWDYQIARLADRAGFDFISVGDFVGVNLWGRDDVLDVTLDEILICARRCGAARRARWSVATCLMARRSKAPTRRLPPRIASSKTAAPT